MRWNHSEGRPMKGNAMSKVVLNMAMWLSIPVLLLVSMFSCVASGYQHLVDFVVCLSAIVLVDRAVQLKEYFCAAGFAGIVVVSSPLLLADKILLFMGVTCVLTLLAAFRAQAEPVELV
jgi:hypothetical protein